MALPKGIQKLLAGAGISITDPVGPTSTITNTGGGGGGITEITSTDSSVTITDPTGPTVDLSVAGGGSSLGIAELAISTTHPIYTSTSGAYAFPFDPVNHLPAGQGQGIIVTIPLCTTAPAGTVVTFGALTVTNIDTTSDEFTIGVQLEVANLDGSETIVLTGTVTASAGAPGDSATVASTDLSVSSQVGSDLSYDPATGIVSTTAGITAGVIAGGGATYA